MRDWVVNVLALGGLGLVVAGLGLMWLPLGVVAAGLCLLLVALAVARAGGWAPVRAPSGDVERRDGGSG